MQALPLLPQPHPVVHSNAQHTRISTHARTRTRRRAAGTASRAAAAQNALPPPPDLQGKNPRTILNATALAYLGDSIWEVLLRLHVMRAAPQPPPDRPKPTNGRTLTIAARSQANATQQASFFDYLWESQGAVHSIEVPAATSETRTKASSQKGKGSGFGFGSGLPSRAAFQGLRPQRNSSSSSDRVSSLTAQGQGVQTGTESASTSPAAGKQTCASVEYAGGRFVSGADGREQLSGLGEAGGQALMGDSMPQQDGGNQGPTSSLQVACLTDEERDVLRWGRNSGAVNVPNSVDSKAYKKATALEVLVAYLYLTDTERCVALVSHLLDRGDQQLQL